MPDPTVQEPPADGLPIFKNGKQTSDTTGDGLPILKKKEESSASPGPSNSPSGSTPTPTVSSTSVSGSDLKANLFGVKSKDDTTPADQTMFADAKGSLIERATTSALKTETDPLKRQAINMRKHELTTKFFSGTLDGKDVDYISEMVNAGSKFDQGLSGDDIANAINNKTKNLRTWSNVAVMKGVDNYKTQLAGINKQLADLDEGREFGVLGGATSNLNADQRAQKRKELNTQKDFLQQSFNSVYEAEKQNVIPKLVSDLKNNIHEGKDWDEIMEKSQHTKTYDETIGIDRPYQERQPYFVEWDSKSKTLTKESAASILKFADDWQKKNKNAVIDAGSSTDLGVSLVNYLNTVPVLGKSKKGTIENWKKTNKEYAPLAEHQQQVNDYFTPEHIKAAESVVKPWQDKQFVLTQEKYNGKNGIVQTNPTFIKIQHKWAEVVGRNEMTPELAKKQMAEEIKNDPDLQKLSKQYDADIKAIQDKGQQMYADFITNGIESSIDPKLVFYKSGNIGVKGKSEAQSREAMRSLNEDLARNAAGTIHAQNEALNLDANQRAERLGFFSGSLKQAAKEQMGALYNWYFHKTGWDGDNARMFQAENLAETPITQSDVAKSWNWEGMKSLLNPKFYASKVASMIPIVAPSAAMTAITEGAGLPEAMSWLGSAGIFTAQDAMSFHNSLLNTTDKYGRTLTDAEVDDATANQAREEFFPNLLFMAVNLGTLARAKGLTKPTIGSAVKEAVAGAASGTIPMAAQGYLTYANQLKARGEKPDMFDYMQDDHFATSLIDGFIGGLGIQLAHTPSNYVKQIKNWKTLMADTGAGEFRDNQMFNVALQHEMAGMGNAYRDAAKLHLFNGFGTPEEKAEVEQMLQYSTALDKNIKDGNIDISSIQGAYQAHSLALADVHDQWAEQAKGNKNLSKIYSDQAKEFKDQAKDAMEGKGKFHYLLDANDQPIFISDQSFKNLDTEGTIQKWMKDGTIKSVHLSDDPNFHSDYVKNMQAEEEEIPRRPPIQPKLEEGQSETIIQALKDHRDQFSAGGEAMYGLHLENPDVHDQLADEIIAQGADHQGNMKDAIGPEAFKIIKPIIDEQIELGKPKVEDLPALREKDEAKKILKQDIPKDVRGKNITVDGETVTANEAIDELKSKYGVINDIINGVSSGTKEDQRIIREKSNAIFNQGYTRAEADIRAAQEYKNDILDKLEDIYKQLDISSPKKVADEEKPEIKTGSKDDKVVSGDRLGDKPIFSDFNSTIADADNKLLPFGEEIKQRIEEGEPVTIVTRSGSEGDVANEKRMLDALGFKEKPENLTIKQGLTPEEKVDAAKGGVLVDNSQAVLDAAEKGNVKSVNANELNKAVVTADVKKPQIVPLQKKTEVEPVELKTEKPNIQEVKIPEPKGKPEDFVSKSGNQKVITQDGKLVVLDKDNNPVSEKTAKKVLKEYADAYDFSVGEKAPEPEVGQIFNSENEAKRWAIEYTKNPTELAAIYADEELVDTPLNSTEHMINELGIGKITQASYEEFGDPNNITNAKARSYFNDKTGLPIDVIAKEMSDHFDTEITPQDIVDFIDRFPQGSIGAAKESEIAIDAKNKFKELTGLDLTHDLAEKVIAKEFDTLDKLNQDLINDSYETEQQLTDEYFKKTQPAETEGPADTTEQQVGEGAGGEPPKEGEFTQGTGGEEDWTAIRRAELTSAKNTFKPESTTLKDEYDKAMNVLAAQTPPGGNIYDTAKARTDLFFNSLSKGQRPNPNTEDLMVMQYQRVVTKRKMAALEDGMIYGSEAEKNQAIAQWDDHAVDLAKLDAVIGGTGSEAGLAFYARQSESRVDPEMGLTIRRMEVSRAKGGGDLSEDEENQVHDLWNQEVKAQNDHDAEVQNISKKEFERRVQDEIKKRMGKTGEKPKRSIKETGKTVANSIRKLKTNTKDRGLQSNIFGLPEAVYNTTIDLIADLVEGGAKVVDAIDKLIGEGKLKFENEDDRNKFQKHILQAVQGPTKEDLINNIANHAKTENATTITMDMVKQNRINDLVGHYIDEGVPAAEILGKVESDLKTILPDITTQQVRDAYLKEGGYTQPRKEKLEKTRQDKVNELKSITKLQTDISDLNSFKDLRSRAAKGNREQEDFEKDLRSKKEKIIQDRKDYEKNLRADNDRIAKERDSQLQRISDLNKKLAVAEGRAPKEIKEKGTPKVETPEIEALKKQIADTERESRDRQNKIRKDNDAVARERDRQLKVVGELNGKLENLRRGVRPDKKTSEPKKDTPEIEALKTQIKKETENLNRIDSEKNAAERRQEKLDKYDKKISDIERTGKAWQQNKDKPVKQIDAEMQKKQQELKDALNRAGIKVDRTDPFTKASRGKVAEAHNSRIEDMAKSIDKSLERPGIADEERNLLNAVKEGLLKSKVDTGTVQDLEQLTNLSEQKLKSLSSLVDRGMNKLENAAGLSSLKKGISDIVRNLGKDKNKSDQEIKLSRYEKQLQNEIDNTIRDIASGNFEDKPVINMPQKSAAAIRLEIEKRAIQSKYRKMQDKARDANKTKLEKFVDLIQKSRVASLIFNVAGLPKIATAGVVKPVLETVTRATTGQLYSETLGRNVAKAYGSEGFSLRSERKAWEATVGAMKQADLEGKVLKGIENLQNADSHLRDVTEKVDQIKSQFGEDSKEYRKFVKTELDPAVSKQKEALLDHAANGIYQWMLPNAWQDAVNIFVNNASRIEELMGNVKTMSPKELENWREKYSYVIDTMGRIHSMIKNFSGRNAFARGYVKRVENALSRGEDILDNDRLIQIANDAYNQDFLAGKFMQNNVLTDLFKGIASGLESGRMGNIQFDRENRYLKYRKMAAAVLRFDSPIVRVPTNILHEAVFEYTLGSIVGGMTQATEAVKGFRASSKEGASWKASIEAMQAHLSQLPTHQADLIGRSFRKGGVGLGMFALGAAATATFGGFYRKGDKKKQPNDLTYKRLMFGDHPLPRELSNAITHNAMFMPFMLGANFARVKQMDLQEKGLTEKEAYWDAVQADLEATLDELPYRNAIDPTQAFSTVPIPGIGLLKNAEDFDEEIQNKNSEPTPRSPQNILERIEQQSGLQFMVPTKTQGDEIKRINKEAKAARVAARMKGQPTDAIDELEQKRIEEIKSKK